MTRHRVTTEWPKTAHQPLTLTCWCDWTWTGPNDRTAAAARREHEGRDRLDRELAAFVRARLAQDRAAAEVASRGRWEVDDPEYPTVIHANDYEIEVVSGGRWGGESSVFDLKADPLHIVRHDPDRVLRQTEAAGDLLDEFEIHIGEQYSGDYPTEHTPTCDILRPFVLALAAIWFEHPDHNEEEWTS